MLALIAWRNIWRNKVRSLILIFSIALGLWAGLFLIAWSWGMNQQRIKSAIQNEISHIQIHGSTFLLDHHEQYLINEDGKIGNRLSANPTIRNWAGRILLRGMLATSRGTAGVVFRGIEPDKEKALTKIDSKIIEGAYFEGVKSNPILISQRIAEKLKLKVKSKVVLNFQDKEGNLIASAFRVAGIYKTNNLRLDEVNVYVKASDLRKLSGYDTGVHEIALLLNDAGKVDAEVNKLAANLPSLKVQSWREISPDLDLMVSSFDQIMTIFMVIILLGLAFGIINTMLMAVLERTKELGMLMAIGMNKLKVFGMITMETVFLVLIGAPVGLLAAYSSVSYYGSVGIDLSMFSKGLEMFGMDTITYPTLESHYYLRILILVVVTAFIASIYPSLKALKLKPAEAVRSI